jgi:hypothetical protein
MNVVPHGGHPNSEHQEQDAVNQAVPRGPESELLDELSLHLLDAVRDREQAVVQLLVDGGANLSAKNTEGQTPLHLAVKNDDVSCLKEELILMQLRQMETSLCMMRLSLVILTSSDFSWNSAQMSKRST